MVGIELVGTKLVNRGTKDIVQELLAENGTVYFVTGFFTSNAYWDLRPDILAFLNRSPDNRLVIVVGTGMDQFSSTIARDLWNIDSNDQINLYQYSQGFLHAKLYARDGPNPMALIGSANLTLVVFEQNLEMGLVLYDESRHSAELDAIFDWVDELLAISEPVRPRNVLFPIQLARTAVNWVNKGRLVPLSQKVRRMPVRVAIFIVFLIWLLFGIPTGI